MQQNVCILLILCILACLLAGCRQTTTAPTDQSITAATTGSSTSQPTNTDDRPKTSITAIPTTSKTTKQYQNNCTLIVDGKDITQGHYVSATIIDRDEYIVYTELPLVAVLEATGWSARCLNDTQIEVAYQDTTVVLDKEHKNFNMPYPNAIAGVNGPPKVRKLVDGEMIVDGGSLMLSFLAGEFCGEWRGDFDMDSRVINIYRTDD